MLAAFESIPRADRVIVALDCPRAKALDLAVALQGKAKWRLKIGMTPHQLRRSCHRRDLQASGL